MKSLAGSRVPLLCGGSRQAHKQAPALIQRYPLCVCCIPFCLLVLLTNLIARCISWQVNADMHVPASAIPYPNIAPLAPVVVRKHPAPCGTISMLRKVLIANRGEIARRIITACRSWGWRLSRSTRMPTATRRLYMRRTRHIGWAKRPPARATSPSRRLSRLPAPVGRTPSIRATGSSPRTPSSRRRVRRQASASSVPRPK